MALSLATIRNAILTSIHGRRLGINKNEFLAGQKDIIKPVTNATSDTTGTALPNHGFVTVVTTTNDTWTLTDPEPGVSVRIATNSTSTGTHTVSCAAATINSSNGAAGSGFTMNSVGAYIELSGLTTAKWALTSRASTAITAVTS